MANTTAQIINFPHNAVVHYDGTEASFAEFLAKVPAHLRHTCDNTDRGLEISQTVIAKGSDIHIENGLIINVTRPERRVR